MRSSPGFLDTPAQDHVCIDLPMSPGERGHPQAPGEDLIPLGDGFLDRDVEGGISGARDQLQKPCAETQPRSLGPVMRNSSLALEGRPWFGSCTSPTAPPGAGW